MISELEAKRLFEVLEGVEGMISKNEALQLFELAKDCKGKGCIVEIGSWKGYSTIALARGSLSGKRSKVYAIDTFKASNPELRRDFGSIDTFPDFSDNIDKAGVNPLVEPIIKTSEEAAKKFRPPIELLFIDGNHVYEDVLNDFNTWLPKVVNGGIIVLHDTVLFDGPRKVAIENFYTSHKLTEYGHFDTMALGRKIEQNTDEDKLVGKWLGIALKCQYITAKENKDELGNLILSFIHPVVKKSMQYTLI